MCAVSTESVPMEDEDNMLMYFTKLEELKVLTAWFNKQGKVILRKNTKKSRGINKSGNSNAKSGFSVPVKVSAALAEFLQITPDELIPRTDVTRRITEYIKSNELQIPENKKQFRVDDTLANVFMIPEGTQTNWFEMQKFLAKILTSVKKLDSPANNTTEDTTEKKNVSPVENKAAATSDKKATPKDAAPKDAAPKDAAPRKIKKK